MPTVLSVVFTAVDVQRLVHRVVCCSGSTFQHRYLLNLATRQFDLPENEVEHALFSLYRDESDHFEVFYAGYPSEAIITARKVCEHTRCQMRRVHTL